jgi:ankyrin repeat protein
MSTQAAGLGARPAFPPLDFHGGFAMLRRALTAGVILVFALAAIAMAQSPDTKAFLKAAREGDLATVRAQLDAGQDVNATELDGYTALMFAVVGQHDEVALLLLDRGADPNIKDPVLGQVPLMFAGNVYRYEKKGLFGMLREQTIDSRPTPVMAALVGHGANVNAFDSRDGWTPLFFSVEASNVDGIRYLLSQGARVNAADLSGMTPLMLAAKSLNASAARELCAGRADPNMTDATGRTAASIAKETKLDKMKGPELETRRADFLSILEACSQASS